MERGQEGRREVERKIRTRATGSKVKQCRGITAIVATVSSLAEKTGGLSTVGTNRACSDGRSGEDKCEDGMSKLVGRICTLETICNRCR